MYLPNLSAILERRSMITTSTPLDKSHFTLDASGVSGFFGDDVAISAMGIAHLLRGQRWLGWYNTPGSYQIAKRYGLIAKSVVFKGLFPGVRTDPTTLFELDNELGPRFQGAASGIIIQNTGHLAAGLMKHCASIDRVSIAGREGPSIGVTIVRLDKIPHNVVLPKRINVYFPFFAVIPITVSLAACVASGVYRDWYSSSLILWGILSNGISCIVIGSGSLCFTHHIPLAGSPPGDGILGSGQEFVLLQGEEGAVNSITLGRFSLEFSSKFRDEYIGYCCILLTIQFIAQLFLIPQASLFGQIMFITSLAVSWIYNSCLSVIDKDKIRQHILLDQVLQRPSLTKYNLTRRTSAVVFALCVLSPEDPSEILEAYLPNNSKVWREWKGTVLRRLRQKEELYFTDADWNISGYNDREKRLLCAFYGDAQAAYEGFSANVNSKGRQ